MMIGAFRCSMVHVRLAVVRQEALHEEGEGLVQLTLRFGGDGVEDERRFPGTGHPGKHGDLLLGNVERDVLEVVLACAANLDELAICHACLFRRACDATPPPAPLPEAERGRKPSAPPLR